MKLKTLATLALILFATQVQALAAPDPITATVTRTRGANLKVEVELVGMQYVQKGRNYETLTTPGDYSLSSAHPSIVVITPLHKFGHLREIIDENPRTPHENQVTFSSAAIQTLIDAAGGRWHDGLIHIKVRKIGIFSSSVVAEQWHQTSYLMGGQHYTIEAYNQQDIGATIRLEGN